ncbi:MAG: GAF domain-containing protein [Sphingomonas sp.]|jgi:transcriptional regulator of acetoin/glycerol metabolism
MATLNYTDHSDKVIYAVESNVSAAVSAVAASWCRSALKYGLDPATDKQRELLGGAELTRARALNNSLLRVARPVLDQMYRSVGKTGCCVILTDAEGLILESRTTAGDAEQFEMAKLTPGARWSEALEGTNGIGTCLAEDRAMIIHRDQHFHSRNIGMSCMDAPVHDHKGRLLAALDVSSCRDDHSEAMAGLVSAVVVDAARRIERDYFCQAFGDARIVFVSGEQDMGAALLAIDRDDLVIGATRAARNLFGLDDKLLASSIPATDLLDAGGRPRGLWDAERTALRCALARAGGNATLAAKQLNIGRATLYRRLKRAGLG